MLGPRPRTLPIAPLAAPARRRLPLADDVRAIDRETRPIYAVWEVTLACDLACRHCGSRAGRARPDELSPIEALNLVDQMADLGVREVTLIGGEAYLRDDFLPLVAAIRERGMRCTMTTGGRSLTRDLARGAKEAGLQSVSVSIDGLRETHDSFRGVVGSFDSAIAAMSALREVGIPVATNTQINRVNLAEIPALFERLIAEKIHSWQMQLTTAMGRAGDEPNLLLEPYQLLDLMPMLARLKKRADEAHVKFWPGNNIGYFGPYEAELRSTFHEGHRGSCGAGRATLGIEANGDIKGCPSLPSDAYVGGNVRFAALKDIWERAGELRFTRDQTASDLHGFCATCYYADECRGGCNWTSHVLLGKIGDNPFCHHRALELLERGERERIVQVESAPGRPFDHGLFEIVREAWPADELARVVEMASVSLD